MNVVCFSVSPSRREQPRGELLALDRVAAGATLAHERVEFAAAEAVLGRARLPVLAQPRQVDLLLRLAGRERGDAGGGEALGAERLHVLDAATAGGSRRRGSPPRALRSISPMPFTGSVHSTPSRRVSSWRSCASYR